MAGNTTHTGIVTNMTETGLEKPQVLRCRLEGISADIPAISGKSL